MEIPNMSEPRSDGLDDLSCLAPTKTFKQMNVSVFFPTKRSNLESSVK